jgi:hypothetical protein
MSKLLAGKKKRRHTPAALPKSACSDSEEKEDDDDDSNLSGVGRRSGASTYAPRTLTRHADTRFATRHPTRDILSELLLEDVRKPREHYLVLPESALQNDSESEYAHGSVRYSLDNVYLELPCR